MTMDQTTESSIPGLLSVFVSTCILSSDIMAANMEGHSRQALTGVTEFI